MSFEDDEPMNLVGYGKDVMKNLFSISCAEIHTFDFSIIGPS